MVCIVLFITAVRSTVHPFPHHLVCVIADILSRAINRLGEEVSELLQRGLAVLPLSPEIRREEAVSESQSIEGSLDEVTQGLAATSGGGVAVLNAGHLKDLLGGASSDDTGTTGGRHQADADGTALA